MGDFNSILHGDDRIGGNVVLDGEVKDFKQFMETANMIGMRCLMSDPLTASRLVMDEKECKVELERWINIEESIMMQKSSVHWLKLGDANTSYFHACLKSRKSILLSSKNQVEEKIMKFYKQLLGTASLSLPAVDITVMGGGNVPSRDQQLQLVTQVEMEEIWN
ncbi:hypothetical protein R3W88_024487 [Solanum pinnatisectum]|uniref:Uncharacterized protein n=1 Tax=Solanum pinnatisectum TaxID=50273 RepID=A0AAV9M0P7_9SOLN|nr:hypothetical protein R3W88_024487 [Solanum pinnatisectum]